MRFLRNLKITHKLSMVLVVVFVGFVAIGLAYKNVLDSNAESVQQAKRLADFGSHIERIQIDLLEARHIEKDFSRLREIELVEQFEIKMTQARDDMAALDKLAPEEIDRAAVNNVQDLFRRYHSDFYGIAEAQMELGLDENSGTQGAMREAVHNVETRVNKLKDNQLKSSILQMRRHEKDFQLRSQEKYIARLTKEKNRFISLVERSKHPAKTKLDITKLINAYHKAFINYTGTFKDKTTLDIATQNTVNLLQPLFNNLVKEKDRVIELNQVAVAEEQADITGVFISILAVSGLLVTVILLLFSRGIITTLGRLRDTVNKVAAGDFTVRARLTTNDELGSLGNAFDELLDERLATLAKAEKENDTLNDSIISLLESVSELSDKNLTVQVPVNEDITGPVADAMNLMTSETAHVLAGIRKVSQDVEQAADLVKQQSDKVTDVANTEREVVETAMQKLDAAAKAMAEVSGLAQSCNDIASQAANSTQTAFDTVTDTAEGMNDIRETISETEKRIKRLGERSQEITTVVDIIKDIAERTHGLALNASMQAAAAGDAGRGFAVVADEVQRLAESSRSSTAQITSLVRSIQSETSETMVAMNKAISQVVEGSGLAEQAGKQMQETQKTTSELVSAVVKIAEQSQAQAAAQDDLIKDTSAIKDSTQETGKELEEQAEHTARLVDYAKLLRDSVHVFKLP